MSTPTAQSANFPAYMITGGVQKLIAKTLSDPSRAQSFCSSIISAVTLNTELKKCDFDTILSCALLGESLGLSPSPQLGQYYLVPFKDKKNKRTVATFMLGYKGYLQLAIRSGQYRNIVVKSIKKGELVWYDDFNEEIKVEPIVDPVERKAAETIGYYAMIEYLNGFRKVMYWSKKEMLKHASDYSAAFGAAPAKDNFPGRVSYENYIAGNYNKKDEWVYSSYWYKDFDAMAHKTMIRQIISKWGMLSVDMCTAFERDGAQVTVTPNGGFEFSDVEPDLSLPEPGASYSDGEPDEPAAEVDGETGELILNDL